MKTLRRSLLFTCLALVSATSLVSASVPVMAVKISTEGGKLVFDGKTDVAGLFTTKALAPGDYVVQLSSHSANGGPFAVVVSAGKKKIMAESVPAAKFANGGVALKLKVATATNLSGQVSQVDQAAAKNGATVMENGHKVKYVNGKKLVWVQGELGSNLGGRWVDADSAEGRNVQSISNQSISDLQQRH